MESVGILFVFKLHAGDPGLSGLHGCWASPVFSPSADPLQWAFLPALLFFFF